MLGFFGKLWIVIKSWFGAAGDDLARSNPEAVFDAAIRDTIERYRKLMDAVAGLATQRERIRQELERLSKEEQDLEVRMEGALAAAEGDPANMAQHQEAYERYFRRKSEIDARQAELEPQLAQLAKTVENYKLELKQFQGRLDALKREKQETVAEKQINEALMAVQMQLGQLSTDNTDQMLATVREHRHHLKEKAKIGQELSGVSTASDDDRYAQMGRQSAGSNQFARLLAERRQAKEGTTAAPEKATERTLG